jgi:hypothetical protein
MLLGIPFVWNSTTAELAAGILLSIAGVPYPESIRVIQQEQTVRCGG